MTTSQPNHKISFRIGALMFILVAMATACGDGEPDKETWVDNPIVMVCTGVFFVGVLILTVYFLNKKFPSDSRQPQVAQDLTEEV